MGRKIPGRKHHGVRDPEKQAAVRFEKIKNKINTAPTNPDHQEVSKTLQRIIDLKDKTKNGAFNRKAKNKKTNGNERPENTPVFKQRPNESDRQFMHRVNKICIDVTREAKFEEKYGVEIKRNEEGEVEAVVKRPKDELEKMIKDMKREKKDKTKKKKIKKKELEEKGEEALPKLTKSQKWQKKKKEKLKKKLSRRNEEIDNHKDNVKFGEIVHAPPTLVAPRRVEKLQSAPRPGKKNLLLKTMLSKSPELAKSQKHDSLTGKNLRQVSNKAIDKKGKRKDLPNALRRQLDTQQKEIINAYKELKAKRYSKI